MFPHRNLASLGGIVKWLSFLQPLLTSYVCPFLSVLGWIMVVCFYLPISVSHFFLSCGHLSSKKLLPLGFRVHGLPKTFHNHHQRQPFLEPSLEIQKTAVSGIPITLLPLTPTQFFCCKMSRCRNRQIWNYPKGIHKGTKYTSTNLSGRKSLKNLFHRERGIKDSSCQHLNKILHKTT